MRTKQGPRRVSLISSSQAQRLPAARTATWPAQLGCCHLLVSCSGGSEGGLREEAACGGVGAAVEEAADGVVPVGVTLLGERLLIIRAVSCAVLVVHALVCTHERARSDRPIAQDDAPAAGHECLSDLKFTSLAEESLVEQPPCLPLPQ